MGLPRFFGNDAIFSSVSFHCRHSRFRNDTIEIFMQSNNLQRYLAENGRLPNHLRAVGDGPDQGRYTPQTGNTFRLTGQVGDITVDFVSSERVESLLGNAIAIVSGKVSSPSQGAPAS